MRLRAIFTAVLAGSLLTGAASAAPSVDVKGARLVGKQLVSPTPGGGSVKLSIDPNWQKVADRLLNDARAPEGAIVVADVKTGKIIAWASRGAGRDFVSSPFAPSASLFKVVTAAALLENNKATPATKQCFTGGEHSVRAKDLEGNGGATCSTLAEGIAKSQNLVLARLAHRLLTPSELRKTATAFGFGVEPMIDIAAPRSDIDIPDDPIGMSRAAAGFGGGHLAPLEALSIMTTIANGGERIKLSVLADSPERTSMGRAVSDKTALEIKHMLEGTTSHGTCYKVFHRPDGSRYLPHTSVAAKTGTLVTGKPTRMFSWFAGFAPSDKPDIAIAVMLGNDVRWWEKANEVGRDFLRAYFEGPQTTHAIASAKSKPARRER